MGISSLYMLRENISMSLSNIINNRLRAFLTTLGIMIGVTAIIALITIVQSVTTEMTEQFTALGASNVNINASGTALKRGLNPSDMQTLLNIENVAGISPNISLTLTVATETGWEEEATVEGRNEHYFASENVVERGRAINPIDTESINRVCLIDKTLMKSLFYGIDPLGKQISISGISHTVIGVLASSNMDLMRQAQGGRDNGRIIVPYTDAMKLSGTQNITSMVVYLKDSSLAEETIKKLEHALDTAFNFKENSYFVFNMQSLVDTMNTVLDMMTALLAGIASISLVVGGIGIMNMMLVSVTERTSEIGLRKALGAQPKHIQGQFLIESFILSVIGGIIGAFLGVGLSALFCNIMDAKFTISWSAISLGVFFSAAVGIVFGWAPARRASNLNPIDALRSM
ncbi:MAG: ABC transporter permease [Eubacteriaceae bacterium]|jgi:putative ABC transport system permease protein|nr:ABC transporter permease [Eubacteriaceae bacterium]